MLRVEDSGHEVRCSFFLQCLLGAGFRVAICDFPGFTVYIVECIEFSGLVFTVLIY